MNIRDLLNFLHLHYTTLRNRIHHDSGQNFPSFFRRLLSSLLRLCLPPYPMQQRLKFNPLSQVHYYLHQISRKLAQPPFETHLLLIIQRSLMNTLFFSFFFIYSLSIISIWVNFNYSQNKKNKDKSLLALLNRWKYSLSWINNLYLKYLLCIEIINFPKKYLEKVKWIEMIPFIRITNSEKFTFWVQSFKSLMSTFLLVWFWQHKHSYSISLLVPLLTFYFTFSNLKYSLRGDLKKYHISNRSSMISNGHFTIS